MTPQVGLVVPEQLMGADLVSFAVSIEDAGLQSAWFTEIGREALVRAAFAAAATSRITIGTAVSLWTRSPVTAATAAAELHQLSSGRFAYGLGCGTQWHNENWHGIDYARPSERLDEYVRAVRGVWGAGKNAADRKSVV